MPKITIQERVPLAPYTTLKVGGPARYFATARNEEEAREAVEFAATHDLPLFVLGGGSNILVSDEGFPGLVLSNAVMGFESRLEGDTVFVSVGAGENWDETVRRAVQKNWAGIECLSGIPGSVGGAAVQNIGAYGQSVDATVAEVCTVDLKSGKTAALTNSQCEFVYRGSLFKKQSGRYLITQVTFALQGDGAPALRYPDLEQYFADAPNAPALHAVRNAVIEIRSRKGYVLLPGYECYQSAGSFFKNPVVSRERFRKVEAALSGLAACKSPWFWELPEDQVKISAACLLERAGFSKGHRQGSAGISPKHALSLINWGGATATELVELAKAIQRRVRTRFGVALEPEVQLVGFGAHPLLTAEEA